MDSLRERFAVEQLHRQEHRLFTVGLGVETDVERAAYVRMRDLARDLDLAAKQLLEMRMRPVRANGLERDSDGQLAIAGLVDLAHAAACDEAHELVARCEYGAG